VVLPPAASGTVTLPVSLYASSYPPVLARSIGKMAVLSPLLLLVRVGAVPGVTIWSGAGVGLVPSAAVASPNCRTGG